MHLTSLLTNQPKKRTLVLRLVFLCIIFLILHQNFYRLHTNNFFFISNNLSEISPRRSQPSLIIPTFLHWNHIDILDFVIYRHPDRMNTFSIYFSGRRDSWTWSEIHCFFRHSNASVRGIIDRRSSEPLVTCPLPILEQQLVINGNSQLSMSIRIKDTTSPNSFIESPNITVPIYWRERHNISIYTMIRNKTYGIIEWIEYHLMIGIEHFYLYDHNSSDHLDVFLRSYLERNIVTIVRWPYQPIKGQHWNTMQSVSMNHALKTFGPFNHWMGYFDIDEYFQLLNPTKFSNDSLSLSALLDQNFPEVQYPGGVQFLNCPISCFLEQIDIISSRYHLLFEKCRHIQIKRDCQTRTKLFIRPRNVPLMQNIHALQFGIKYASSSTSSSFAHFRHYHYGVVGSTPSANEIVDTSMNIFINDLKEQVITYRK